MEGLQQLAELVAQGGSRISVMPGGGVDAENAATVARVTGGPAGGARAGVQRSGSLLARCRNRPQ